MRRLLIFALTPLLVCLAIPLKASAEAPLCALSSDFERQLLSTDAVMGAAVYDLESGTIWSGGHSGPYALHSVIKPPIAWAVLTDAHEQQRELTKLQRDALFYMVAWSQNPDVTTLLSMVGGLSGFKQYYERWGVPELIELTHQTRWGASLAEPVHLARLFAALAMSEAVPDNARSDGFDLLRAVVDNHRWGASIPEQSLHGWESLIKTGNFTIPESEDADPIAKIDPRSYEEEAALLNDLRLAEAEAAAEVEEGDTPLKSQATKIRAIVRMNSAAIWLAPPWQGSQPRYVVTIMQESFLSWTGSRAFQNEIGQILANAIAHRESGEWTQPANHCIKRALS
ncbi:MAG: hypothetical protein OXD50_08095 [Chloroflexi bacterium]|nr:hypothetical protein [Chloroflexota bacterium]